jgi:hypothetical protein
MKLVTRCLKPVLILSGLFLVMPLAAVADKPDAGSKGGKPNKNSVAVTEACVTEENTARVCSCKGLSNVVLWCGSTWVKHEDFGSDTDTGEVYYAEVGCVDSEGNAIPGPIGFIAVKSGSQKHAKHLLEGYEVEGLPEGAPSGSGLFQQPKACSDEDFACPTAGDCTGSDDPDSPGDEEPPDMGVLG